MLDKWLRLGRGSEKDPDPTTFSPTPAAVAGIERQPDKDRYYVDGDPYWVVKKHPATQQVVTRILKGVINVSDVIKYQPDSSEPPLFLSKEMPLADIEHETTEAEVNADIFLIAALFSDLDHNLPGSDTMPGHRFNATRLGNRIAHLDFEHAYEDFFGNSWKGDMMIGRAKRLPLEARAVLRKKINILQKRLEGEGGRAFTVKLIEQTGEGIEKIFKYPMGPEEPSQEELIERFYKVLTERLRGIDSTLASLEVKK